MNIKDLDKEDYFMYTNTVGHTMSQYYNVFWYVAIFIALISLDIFIEGLTISSIIGMILFVGLLIFNMVELTYKMDHIKRLFKVDKGFSLLK